MTLEQWKDEAALRFAGSFEIDGDVVRHEESEDDNGFPCCPLVVTAMALVDTDDTIRWANAEAVAAGIAMGLPECVADMVVSVADNPVADGSPKYLRDLRRWMERVLVDGEEGIEA